MNDEENQTKSQEELFGKSIKKIEKRMGLTGD